MTLYQDAQPAQQAQLNAQQAQQQAQAARADLMRAQAELRRAEFQARLEQRPVGVPLVIERPRGSTEKQEKMFFVAFLVVVLAAAAILYPIARAFARRLEGGVKRAPELGAGTAEQLLRIEHTVEAMAIEIERLSEGQRFTTKLLASRADALGAATDAERARPT